MVRFRANFWKGCPVEKIREELEKRGYFLQEEFSRNYSYPNGVSYSEVYYVTDAPLKVFKEILSNLKTGRYDDVLDKNFNCILILEEE